MALVLDSEGRSGLDRRLSCGNCSSSCWTWPGLDDRGVKQSEKGSAGDGSGVGDWI